MRQHDARNVAPINEAGMNKRNPQRNWRSSEAPFDTQVMMRVVSIKKAIAPAVAIYTVFFKSKAVRKTLRIAPPTPNIPAKNPDDGQGFQ